MVEHTLGVIGGSGLYELPGLEAVERVRVTTPFGDPSDEFVVGRLGHTRLVFLPRHGRGHRLLPTEVNFRANIYGMKTLGAEWIVAVSAGGSLREGIAAHADVEIEDVLRVLSQNVDLARRTVVRVAAGLPTRTGCPCPNALQHAIITERAAIPEAVRRELAPIVGRYLGQDP